MSTATEHMIAVGETDTRIFGLNLKLRRIPVRLAEARRQLEAEEALLNEVLEPWTLYENEVRERDTTIKIALDTIEKFEEHMKRVTTQKEYMAARKQVDEARRLNTRLQDEILDRRVKQEELAPRLEERRAKGKVEGEGWTLRGALRTRVFWGLAQIFFCTAAGMFCIVVQLVAFLIDAGYSPLVAATSFGAIGMLSAASIMGSGFLSDRFGYRQTASVSFVGTATGMAILLLITASPSLWLLVLFVPVFGLCMGVRGPIVSSIGARYFAGPSVATIYGVIYATNALGAATGSWLGGLLHDFAGGYRPALFMALAFIACAAAPFWTVPALKNFR